MSWAKAIWTVNEVLRGSSQIIADQNIGIDAYIATMPRGLLQRIVSDGGSVEINGSGWVVRAWSVSSGQDTNWIAPLYITIDHAKTIDLTTKGGLSKTSEITTDNTKLYSTIDLSDTNISLINQKVVINKPIRFNNYLKVVTNKLIDANSGVEYIIDSRGGV